MVFRATERYREGWHLMRGSAILVQADNEQDAARMVAKQFPMFELLLISTDATAEGYTVNSQPLPGLECSGLYARGAGGRAVRIL